MMEKGEQWRERRRMHNILWLDYMRDYIKHKRKCTIEPHGGVRL